MPTREAVTTPIAHIYLALDGHVEYLTRMSPFRGGPVIDEKPKTADDVAENVRNVLGGLARGKRDK